MHRRQRLVYIRRTVCRAKAVRCTIIYFCMTVFMICIGIRLFWALVMAGLATLAISLLIRGRST